MAEDRSASHQVKNAINKSISKLEDCIRNHKQKLLAEYDRTSDVSSRILLMDIDVDSLATLLESKIKIGDMRKLRKDESKTIAVSKPRGIAIAENGEMFVTTYTDGKHLHGVYVYAETKDGRMVRKRFIGSNVGSGKLEFNKPHGICIWDNTVYVTEYAGNRIHMFTTEGEFLGYFGETGSAKGQFSGPHDIKVSPDGKHLCVADRNNDRVQVFNLLDWSISHVIQDLSICLHPEGIAFDSNGNIHVTGYGSYSISVFDCNGKHVYQYGQVNKKKPKGIIVDSSGFSWVSCVGCRGSIDEEGFLLVFNANGSLVYSVSGFLSPFGLLITGDGSMWTTDEYANKVTKYCFNT